MTREAQPQTLPFFQRLVHALPDAVTAGIFLFAWIAPLHWRETLVAELQLVMVIEFALVHSAPFLGSVVLVSDVPLKNRLVALAGLTAFYGLFIGAYAAAYKMWWPVIAFAWLITAKLVSIVTDRHHTERQKQRMRGYWFVSFGFYLLAVFATVFIPFPEFGITRHGSAYGISGNSGEWVSHPHTVIAAGFLYFGLLAVTKLFEQPTWWRNLDRNAVKAA
jgi:hypothetical protein